MFKESGYNDFFPSNDFYEKHSAIIKTNISIFSGKRKLWYKYYWLKKYHNIFLDRICDHYEEENNVETTPFWDSLPFIEDGEAHELEEEEDDF